MSLQPGTKLGPYEILELAGAGGMGVSAVTVNGAGASLEHGAPKLFLVVALNWDTALKK